MIRCVVFDFDGTLVLSNGIKRDGFLAVAAAFPEGLALMERILVDPPGDRYAILTRFAFEFGVDASALATSYSRWCEDRIAACPERSGASAAMDRLRQAGLRVYVNSATPSIPLRTIISRRYGMDYFDGVYGGHGAKVENLCTIVSAETLSPDAVVMVGDGTDDREAARIVGCRFIGIAEGTLAGEADSGVLLESLEGLWSELCKEQGIA